MSVKPGPDSIPRVFGGPCKRSVKRFPIFDLSEKHGMSFTIHSSVTSIWPVEPSSTDRNNYLSPGNDIIVVT